MVQSNHVAVPGVPAIILPWIPGQELTWICEITMMGVYIMGVPALATHSGGNLAQVLDSCCTQKALF